MKTVAFYTRPSFMDAATGLLEALARRCDVHLVVELSPEGRLGPLGSVPDDLPAGICEGNLDWAPEHVAGRLSGLKSFHFAVFTSARAFHPSNALVSLRIARLLKRAGVEVVHFDDTTSRGLTLPYLMRRIPSVLTIHDPRVRVGEPQGRVELVRRKFLEKASALIFRSDYSARTLLSRYPDCGSKPRATIPLGIYDVFAGACSGTPEEPRTILFFGHVSHYKGIDTLFAAAPLVAERVEGLRVVVAGLPGAGYAVPDAPPLPNGGAWELLLEHVTPARVCELFGRAAVVVLPYVEASQSGVVATASAFQVPVVASAVGGIPEDVVDGATGLLVPPRDPGALADALAGLLLDPAGRNRMEDALRERQAGPLAWGRLAAATLDAYALTVPRSGRGG